MGSYSHARIPPSTVDGQVRRGPRDLCGSYQSGSPVWSLPALFVGAGVLLTVSSVLAASSRAARGID